MDAASWEPEGMPRVQKAAEGEEMTPEQERALAESNVGSFQIQVTCYSPDGHPLYTQQRWVKIDLHKLEKLLGVTDSDGISLEEEKKWLKERQVAEENTEPWN